MQVEPDPTYRGWSWVQEPNRPSGALSTSISSTNRLHRGGKYVGWPPGRPGRQAADHDASSGRGSNLRPGTVSRGTSPSDCAAGLP